MKNLFATLGILSFLALATACTDKNTIEIDGQFLGHGEKMVYLERLSSPSATTAIIDSVKSDEKGNFSFEIKEAGDLPTFYNIRLDNGYNYVPLLLEGGEKLSIKALGSVYYSYTVDGSKGSELVKEYHQFIRDKTLELDSLASLSEREYDDERRQRIGVEYAQTQIQLKRGAIQFVVKNAGSMAALLPIYYPLENGLYIFDAPEDFVYYKMVSDSLGAKYPSSPYARALQRDLQNILGVRQIDSMINAQMTNVADFPEVEMKDHEGKTQKLSSYKGKVVLLSFTASNPTTLKAANRELVEMYQALDAEDFVIFQVSLDADKSEWLRSVSEQRLPWISVNDFQGSESPAVRGYNVKTLPANVLIDRNGSIIGRNLSISEISTQAQQALNGAQ